MTTTVKTISPNAYVVKSTTGSFTLLTADSATGIVTSALLSVTTTNYLTGVVQGMLATDSTLGSAAAFPGYVTSLCNINQVENSNFTVSAALGGTTVTLSVSGLQNPSHCLVSIPFSSSPSFAPPQIASTSTPPVLAGLSIINVQSAPYNAAGNGTTDDTAAIQAAINALSANATTGAAAVTGILYFPRGTYKVTSQLRYYGDVSHSIQFYGDTGLARGGTEGSCFLWAGAVGGTMLAIQGGNGTIIQNLCFNGGAKTDQMVLISELNPTGLLGFVPSSGTIVRQCLFTNPNSGTQATNLSIGLAVPGNQQASEIKVEDCYFFGHSTLQAGGGIVFNTPGNCKNVQILRCFFTDFKYGVSGSFSGYSLIRECSGSNIGNITDGVFLNIGGNTVDVLGGAFENGTVGFAARFLVGGQATTVFIEGVYISGTTPADDYMIITNGPTTLNGVDFDGNSRVGANHCKLQINCDITDAAGTTSVSYASISMIGCKFQGKTTALTFLPIYDGSGNPLCTGDFATNTEHDIFVLGNRTGISGGNTNIVLRALSGQPFPISGQMLLTDANDAGITIVRKQSGLFVCTIPYTSFQTSNTTKALRFAGIKKRWKITGTTADVTAAFAGTAGTLQLKVGTAGSTSLLLVAADVKSAPVTLGVADADFGNGLARATAVAGGTVPSWSVDSDLVVTLTSGSGNLSGLTQGSVTLYVEFVPKQ